MADHSDLNPENLRRGLVNEARTKLKPGLITPDYTSGTPTNASQIKPSLRNPDGSLKAGLTYADGTLKPSVLKLFGEGGGGGGGGGSLIPASLYQALLFGGDTFDSQGYLRDSSPGQGTYRLPRPAYVYTFNGTNNELRWTQANTGTQYVSYYNLGTEAWVGPVALTYDTDHYSFQPAAVSITNLKRWSDNTATTEEIEATEFATAPSNLLSWHPCCEESGTTSYDIYDGQHANIVGTLTGFHSTNTNLTFSFPDHFGYSRRMLFDGSSTKVKIPGFSTNIGHFDACTIDAKVYIQNANASEVLWALSTSSYRVRISAGNYFMNSTNTGVSVTQGFNILSADFDSSGRGIALRVNGVEVWTGVSSSPVNQDGVFHIGGSQFNGNESYFTGTIFDFELSGSSVDNFRLEGYGATDADWLDITGNGNDGVVFGSPEELIIPAESATLDAIGGALQYSGRTPYPARNFIDYIQGDGTGVRADVGDVSLSPTTITARLKQDADNQPLFTLQNSAATGVSVVAGVLTFGASLTVSQIKVDDAVVTASAAGLLLNDNAYHKLELTLTAIRASNLRLHTTTSSNYGNVEIADFRLSDGTVTKTIVPEVPVGSSTPDKIWIMGSDGSATEVPSAIKGTLTNVHGSAPLPTEDWYMRYGGRHDSVNNKLIPAKTDGTGADGLTPDSTGGELLPGQQIDMRGGVDSAFAQKVNLESEYTYGDARATVAPTDTKRKRSNDSTEDHYAAAPTAIPDSSAFTD